MHQFWGHLIMDKGFNPRLFFSGFYNLFAEVGAGVVYWYLFGILGSISFLSGVTGCVNNIRKGNNNERDLVLLYSTLLLLVVMILFISGKFPLGEPRLNAFAIPSIAVIMICFLDRLSTERGAGRILSKVLSIMLYIGVTGNIYTTFYASVTGPEYTRKMEIYRSTEKAILLAQSKNLPILITPEVAWPYNKTLNYPFKNTVPGDWVLKTFPSYHFGDNIPVYAIPDLVTLDEYIKHLPIYITSVLAGDGRSFQIIYR